MSDERAELVERLRKYEIAYKSISSESEPASTFKAAADYIESQAVAGEAVYQWELPDGDWRDCAREAFERCSVRPFTQRVLYTKPQPAPVIGVPDYVLKTHRAAWRIALKLVIKSADAEAKDGDEAAFWRHELAVFDRTFETLVALTAKQHREVT